MTTDTKELEERLRERSENWVGGASHLSARLDRQAADALASMRAENERLRDIPRDQPPEMGSPEDKEAMGWIPYKDHCEALAAEEAEVDRLRTQRDEAVEALGPFVDFAETMNDKNPSYLVQGIISSATGKKELLAGHFFDARTVYNTLTTGEQPVQEGESDG